MHEELRLRDRRLRAAARVAVRTTRMGEWQVSALRTAAAAVALTVCASGLAAQQSPVGTNASGQTAPRPALGVTPLPQGPPLTTQQAPLPRPAGQLPPPARPALESPGLSVLFGRTPPRPLTVDDVVGISLATNPQLAQASAALLLAQGRRSEAATALNPSLSGNFTYTRLNTGEVVNFGGQSVTVAFADQPVFSLSATLPIDIAGMLRAAVSQAQFQEIAARLDVNRARNQVVQGVKTAFYNALRAEALVAVAQETLRNTLDQLSDAQKKFQAGVVARFDVIQAQTNVANAQQDRIQAENQVSVAMAQLKNAMGVNIDAPIEIAQRGAVEEPPGVEPPTAPSVVQGAGEAPPSHDLRGAPPVSAPNPPGEPAPPPTAPEVVSDPLADLGPAYRNVLDEALKTRPEILQADASVAASQKGVFIARRTLYPTLGITGSAVYQANVGAFSPLNPSEQIAVSLTVPIYEAGLARARVVQARADVATAETNRRIAIDSVTLDVREAYLTLIQTRARVAVANQALGEARESFRLARVRYNAGVSSAAGISPLIEVSNAQTALTQAESNQVSALYDYNNARAALDSAIGRYSYQPAAPGYPAPPTPRAAGFVGPGVPR